jgi:two-component system, chemotaxis family, sensor kinase Cph1
MIKTVRMTEPKRNQNEATTLRQENEELKSRLGEAEETIRALRSGEVDAIVIYGPEGPSVFTLQGAEHAYRVMVETMTEGAVTTSLDGTVLYGNPSMEQIVGTPVGAIMGKPLAEFVAPAERRKFADFLKRARLGSARGRFRLGSGAVHRTAYFSSARLGQEEAEPQICMVVTDLTELEATADKLREAQAEKEILQASEKRFRLLAEAVPQIVWTADPDGDVDYYNRKWTEFSGIPQKKSLGWKWSAAVHPDDREQSMATWRRSVAEGTPCEIEHRLRRADGAYRWFLSRALPIRDEQGRVLRWFGTATEITELREAQRALEKTNEELGRSNQELEQFAYIASHDLQTPLRSITGFLDLLSRRYQGKLGPEADEFIAFAVDGAQRMHQLINDILAFSRVTTHGLPFGPVDCRAILDRALVNLRAAIGESGAVISQGELPTVGGDESQLAQLFQNLVDNAIKYRKPGEPPRIHVAAEEKETEWVFRVEDNGIGFDPRHTERVFQIFQRLHTTSEYSGTGIGLAICKKIVERHDGRMWVETEPGQGSTFYFTLPKA